MAAYINENRLLSFQNPPDVFGVPVRAWDISYKLPGKVQERGIMLLDVTYQQPEDYADPYIIFDDRGKVLYSWPEGYIPGPREIWKVAESLLQ